MRIVPITWRSIHKYGSLWVQSHELRHAMFIERLAYQVPHHDGLEWDQYDSPRATYLVVDDGGRCAGVCRLLSTTHPYMIQEVFPDLLPYAAPRRDDVWEASRIAVDPALPPDRRDRALRTLILGVQKYGYEHGITHFLGLMPVAIFRRTLIRNGVGVRILSDQARPIDGVNTAVGEIAVSPATIDHLAQRLAVPADGGASHTTGGVMAA